MTYTPLEKNFSKILELESNYSKTESSSTPNFPQILNGYDKKKNCVGDSWVLEVLK